MGKPQDLQSGHPSQPAQTLTGYPQRTRETRKTGQNPNRTPVTSPLCSGGGPAAATKSYFVEPAVNPSTTDSAVSGTAPLPADLPGDLGLLSTADLQKLVAAAADELHDDQDGGARDRYLAVLDGLERRGDPRRGRERSVKPKAVKPANTTVYNNHLHGRFELFVDGTLVAYLKYEMHRGELWALRVTVDPDYRRRKVQALLIEEVLADALRSRIAVLPFCPLTRAHLAARPEYRRLVPREHRDRFTPAPQRKLRRRRPAQPRSRADESQVQNTRG